MSSGRAAACTAEGQAPEVCRQRGLPYISNPFQVRPGVAARLALSALPSTQAVAGNPLVAQPVLQLFDEYGNPSLAPAALELNVTITDASGSNCLCPIGAGRACLTTPPPNVTSSASVLLQGLACARVGSFSLSASLKVWAGPGRSGLVISLRLAGPFPPM